MSRGLGDVYKRQLLGGGGHAAAAGATLHGTLGEVKQAVLQAIDMVAGED